MSHSHHQQGPKPPKDKEQDKGGAARTSERTNGLHAQIEELKCQLKAKDDEAMKAKDEKMKAQDETMKAQDEKMNMDKEMKALEEELAKNKEKTKAIDEKLKAQDEKMKIDEEFAKNKEKIKAFKKKFPTMREIAKFLRRKHNETESSAHTRTGHKTVTFEKFQVLPDIDDYLEESGFWEYRPGINARSLSHSVNSESDVSFSFRDLLLAVIDALKLDDALMYKNELPMMDVCYNRVLAHTHDGTLVSTIKSKKEPRGDEERNAMFGSGTQVAGEVCDQLFLSHIQMRTQTFGVLTTFNELRLVSTGDLTGEALDVKGIVEFFDNEYDQNAGGISFTKPQVVVAPHKRPGIKQESSKRARMVSTEEGKPQQHVQQKIRSVERAREYFASGITRLGQDAATNEEYIKLLALYVLLSAKSLQERLINGKKTILSLEKLENVPARTVNTEKRTMGFSSVSSDIIRWEETPSKDESIFYSLQQLGYGSTGCCCLALSDNLVAPCAIKFYDINRPVDQVLKMAQKEAQKWDHLYGDRFEFVKVVHFGKKVMLIMPFLDIASDAESRISICCAEGGDPLVNGPSKESKLYKALTYMAVTKKRKHMDLCWRHIGQYYTLRTGYEESSKASGFKRCGQSIENEFESEVIFCDLEALQEFDEGEDAVQWADAEFKFLYEQISILKNVA